MKQEERLKTLQRLFSNAYIGLKAQQWKPSHDLDRCAYFSTELNLKCAIGHSIPEHLYTKEFEGFGIPTNLGNYKSEQIPIITKLVEALKIDQQDSILVEQLQYLQGIHDKYVTGSSRFDNSMKSDLEIYAENCGLQIPTDDYVITY